VTNLDRLTSHSTTSCLTTWRSCHDHRLLWCHFTLCICTCTAGVSTWLWTFCGRFVL